jgi:predicted enzyme related to lactoylglutathione lyase
MRTILNNDAMPARLSAIDLRVRDVDVAFRFYRDLLGLDIEPPVSDGPNDDRHTHAVWGSAEAGTRLLLTLRPQGGEPPSVARLAFDVTDLDARHVTLTNAGTAVRRPPQDMPWGRSAAYVDPDGNIISLIQRHVGK